MPLGLLKYGLRQDCPVIRDSPETPVLGKSCDMVGGGHGRACGPYLPKYNGIAGFALPRKGWPCPWHHRQHPVEPCRTQGRRAAWQDAPRTPERKAGHLMQTSRLSRYGARNRLSVLSGASDTRIAELTNLPRFGRKGPGAWFRAPGCDIARTARERP